MFWPPETGHGARRPHRVGPAAGGAGAPAADARLAGASDREHRRAPAAALRGSVQRRARLLALLPAPAAARAGLGSAAAARQLPAASRCFISRCVTVEKSTAVYHISYVAEHQGRHYTCVYALLFSYIFASLSVFEAVEDPLLNQEQLLDKCFTEKPRCSLPKSVFEVILYVLLVCLCSM